MVNFWPESMELKGQEFQSQKYGILVDLKPLNNWIRTSVRRSRENPPPSPGYVNHGNDYAKTVNAWQWAIMKGYHVIESVFQKFCHQDCKPL